MTFHSDNPGISVRCQKGHHCHKGKRWGCRCSVLQCSCACHISQPPVIKKSSGVRGESTAMVRVIGPKSKAKMVPIHEIGCSKKPCVCSDIRAGKAAKKIVTGFARLFVEALFKPAEGAKKDPITPTDKP